MVSNHPDRPTHMVQRRCQILARIVIPGTSDTLINKPRAAVTNVLSHPIKIMLSTPCRVIMSLCTISRPFGNGISVQSVGIYQTRVIGDIGQDKTKPFSKADSWGISSSPTLGNWIAIDDCSDPIATSNNLYCTNETHTNVTSLSLMPGGVFYNSAFAQGLQDDWPFYIGHYWVINSKDVRIITFDDDKKVFYDVFSDAKQAVISFGDGRVILDPMSNDTRHGYVSSVC